MAKKEETKMAVPHEVKHEVSRSNATPVAVIANPTTLSTPEPESIIKLTSVPYTVPALNLELGVEEKVTFKGSAFSVPRPEHHNASTVRDLLDRLGNTNIQIDALCAALKSQSYQVAKATAMGDKYLDSNLRTRIVTIMKGTEQFGSLTAGECYERWVSGYKLKKPGAMRILEQAQASAATEEYDF